MSFSFDVAESARSVVNGARCVTLDGEAIDRWAAVHHGDAFQVPAPPPPLRFAGTADQTANFILLIDCLNFCFWSDAPWSIDFKGKTWTRTYAMYAGVLRAIERDAAWLTPQCWADADAAGVSELFAGQGQIPLIEARQQVLNETGQCLIGKFDGQFVNVVEQADRRAPEVACLLAEHFPSFADIHRYAGHRVAILKRAQICAADLHHAWTRQQCDGLSRLEALTVFADYRLPQYLRHVGILQLSGDLAERIDTQQEIQSASPEEIELRCAAIEASRRLVTALTVHGTRLAPYQLDFVLWERSHDAEVTCPHHRTRCIYY